MKNAIIILLLIFNCHNLSSQTLRDTGKDSWNLNRQEILVPFDSNANIFDASSLRDVKGSPYENENFQKGAIYYKGKLIKDDILLRYNIYADQFEIKEDAISENITAIAYDPNITLKMDGADYIYVPFTDVDNEGNYYKVVTKNKTYNLLKRLQVTFNNIIPAKTSFHQETPASFVREDLYFLKSNTDQFIELPARVNKLAKALSPKSNEIKSFIKENNIDLKDEKNLARLIRYYDSIMN